MEFHSIANIFPLLSDDRLQELAEDIATHGLKEPAWLYEGKVLDGRNRSLACAIAGVKLRTKEFKGDQKSAIDFVWSENFIRRQLNSSQRAMAVADRKDLDPDFAEFVHTLVEEAKKRQKEGGKKGGKTAGKGRKKGDRLVEQNSTSLCEPEQNTRETLARLYKTNYLYIAKADTLRKEHPDEAQAIRDGKKTISKVMSAIKHEESKRKAAAQVAASPTPPAVTLASWDAWLPSQPDCDLLLTDPPYSTDMSDIVSFANTWLPAALAKVKPTGSAYVCIGAYPKELQAYLNTETPIPLAQVLVWTYRNTLGPAPNNAYKLNWQAILYYRGPEAPALDYAEMKEQFSVQDISAPDGRVGDRYHAWQKPDELAERLVRHASKAGQLVLDPFCCTGAFLIAASKLGRIGRGCDNSRPNLDIAVSRGCHEA